MENVAAFLGRTAEKIGYVRERFDDGATPTSFDNVVAVPFYGDMRGEVIFSSLLLPRLRELMPHKYVIVCSYAGHAGLYQCADEYWGLKDDNTNRILMSGAVEMENHSDHMTNVFQQLNRYFSDVRGDDHASFYKNGLKQEYFSRFGDVTRTYPSLPSPKLELARLLAHRGGLKVFIHPEKMHRAWIKGREISVPSNEGFWVAVCERLLSHGMLPVIWQDQATYDLSRILENQCVYVREGRVLDVLAAMRATGCVLDVFSGLSWLASVARTPFVSCVERTWYNETKSWELDDLLNSELPHQHIFGFPTIIGGGFSSELIETMAVRLSAFIPGLDRERWPSTAEQKVEVPYSCVRQRKAVKIGSRFIKVARLHS